MAVRVLETLSVHEASQAGTHALPKTVQCAAVRAWTRLALPLPRDERASVTAYMWSGDTSSVE
ncbi:hypothetical protein ACFQ9Z_18090 [Streptomyces sp. NPDC056580]|uniref:hypothetical protein n=1 Tax=Streptomyces sp. NPDC056580 TaxID=3345872 RepID=UPI0036A39117